jgi:hypothetical protein
MMEEQTKGIAAAFCPAVLDKADSGGVISLVRLESGDPMSRTTMRNILKFLGDHSHLNSSLV